MMSHQSYLSRLGLLSVLGAAMAVATGAASSPARAADAPGPKDWAHWRGPSYNGTSAATNLPEKFGKDENVLWKAALPGPSNGTPIVLGDRVFTTALDSTSKKLYAIALDRATGNVAWQHEVGVGFKEKGENNMATPSPVTDGKVVYFLFGTGDLAAFDLAGKQLWARNLQKEIGPFNIMWIYGSSPTVHKGKLYVQVLHKETPYGDTALPGAKAAGQQSSYLLALDPASGKEIWRHDRPDDAVSETKESYATPIPHTTATGREEIVLVGGDAVTGHDPETGRELWRFTGWNPEKIGHWRMVPSVVAASGMIIACAPKNGPVMAIREGGNGDVSQSHKAWFSDPKQVTSDVPVPLFYKDHLYVLDHNGQRISKVDPKTGDAKWTTKLEGGRAVARASPLGADNKVYAMNVDGTVWVVSPDDGKVLHQTSLGVSKAARGSIAAADGMILVRAGNTLYAFGEKK